MWCFLCLDGWVFVTKYFRAYCPELLVSLHLNSPWPSWVFHWEFQFGSMQLPVYLWCSKNGGSGGERYIFFFIKLSSVVFTFFNSASLGCVFITLQTSRCKTIHGNWKHHLYSYFPFHSSPKHSSRDFWLFFCNLMRHSEFFLYII